MSSPSLSSGTPRPADLFEDLWRQLRETHQNALLELEEKVNKLKKERCLDAQKLEVFYNRNQQLKEQNKTLQDAVSLLEERPQAGECEQCAILRENLRNNQVENLHLIAKLKNDRISLEDQNRKLQTELQKLKTSHSEQPQTSSPEQEEGIIPDSPILPSSLPAANKLRKRRNVDKIKHVRYAEIPLPQSNSSLFNEVKKEPGRVEVLVPNTCELDSSQTSNYVNQDVELEVAETCALELLDRPHMKTEKTTGQQSSSKSSWKFVHLNPDSTSDRSPSLLPRVKRFSEDDFVNKAKRKKEESEPEDKQGKNTEPEVIKGSASPLSSQSFKETLDSKVQSAHRGTSSQRQSVSCVSPAFKKPHVRGEAREDAVGKKENSEQHLNASQEHHGGGDAPRKHRVEPSWSIDPALALSMYDSEKDEECDGELVDTDCTWVSHSLLQRRDRTDSVSGLGEKANDSLDMMFDTTAYGEFQSYNSPHLGQSQPCEEEEEGDDDDDDEHDPDDTTLSQIKGNKAGRPAFAHVAVIRKKEERRKLKGTTCKECEVYYAHLPEEEKQKKLSSCSRHRFLYIPPCTPENFWEVGFPSTQTCIERGYIREEKNPEARTRRRQPFNALFSPKRNKQESNDSFSL